MCIHEQLSTDEDSGKFASSPDFCHIFARQLNSYYRLAFLLTASHHRAERCTLASLDEALNADGIPRDLAEPWSKRTVIKNALHIARGEESNSEMTSQQREEVEDEFVAGPFDRIVSLNAFERFVLVLSVLEKISDSECSRLVGCAVSQIGPARLRALEQLSKFDGVEKQQSTQRQLSLLMLRGERALTRLRTEASKVMSQTVAVKAIAPKPPADARECI